MKIYRIENKERQGPYWDFDHSKWRTRSHEDSDRWPNIMFDENVDEWHDYCNKNSIDKDNFICGFKNLNQLEKWLTKKEIENLKNHGFKIVTLFPKTVFNIGKQVVFIDERKKYGKKD